MLPGIDFSMAGLDRLPVVPVGSATDVVDRSGSYTFAGLDFGPEFPGRIIVAIATLYAIGNVILNQTSVTIGGVSAGGDDTGDAGGGAGAPNGSCGVGIWGAKPSGQTGSVTVNFTSGTASAASVSLYAVADAASATPSSTFSATSASGYTSGASGSLSVPSGAVVFGAAVRANNTSSITLTGVTPRTQANVDSAHRVAIGYDYRMQLEASRSVGFTTGSADVVFGTRFATFV